MAATAVCWFCVIVVWANAAICAAIEVPVTRQWHGGFQCDFCYKMTEHVHNWKAHILFTQAVDKLEIYAADILETLDGGKEFVVVNKAYDATFEAGKDLCLKFTARISGSVIPKVSFYIEGINNPVDTHGNSRTMSTTTASSEQTHTKFTTKSSSEQTHTLSFWGLQNMDPYSNQTLLEPFRTQTVGHFDEGSLSVSEDPAGLPGKVLRVYYQKGSYVNVHSHRGAQFYSRPTDSGLVMTLSYDIYFSPGFDFVKGGKLPGLFGGATNCSGGRHSDACFSTRLMWRGRGDGEVYAYIPVEQISGFCQVKGTTCNAEYGNSLGRGAWRFKAGEWQSIKQRLELNAAKQTNGKLKVWHNGQLVYTVDTLNFRNNDDIKIEGMFFSTFFGGSDPSWAPTADCYTYYKNFYILTDGDASLVGK